MEKKSIKVNKLCTSFDSSFTPARREKKNEKKKVSRNWRRKRTTRVFFSIERASVLKEMVAKRFGFALTLCAVILSSFGAQPAWGNFPVVRFKNQTVGIVTEKSGDVLIRGNRVSMNGDLILSENGNVISITDAMINLRAKEEDMVARILKIKNQPWGLKNICNPFNTEYIEKNTTSGEYGACVCKEGYAGEECESIA
jgi:hypothetical protein